MAMDQVVRVGLFLLFVLQFSLAVPTSDVNGRSSEPSLQFIPISDSSILCKLPIIKDFLCPPQSGSNGQVIVQTTLGAATGVLDTSEARRFSVRYASANRWEESVVVKSWDLPNGSSNVSTLPLACPQPNVDSSLYSEDCLSIILYVPPGLNIFSNVPTLVWIHGGSFITGSASAPGLDGSNLAIATSSIVAVVQYRLGALGFMAPDGSTNLALKDIVNALKFLHTVLPSFGGSASTITVAGQSSGANMIRALLSVPSASSLFQSAIMQSDPMNYGLLTPSIQSTLQDYFNSVIGCSDVSCTNALSLDTIIDSQTNLFDDAINLAAGAGNAEPIRPVQDGSFITKAFISKPILVTSVLNEAGITIYGNFPSTLASDQFSPVTESVLGTSRTETIDASPYYQNGSDARVPLQLLGTDYMWKCSGWTFARNWTRDGGTAFVGLYTLGATYPGNDAVPYCLEHGIVCHQDDIMIVFGTVMNPTSEQSSLISEMQKRYKAFLYSSTPNVNGLSTWQKATTSDVNALNLGGSSAIPDGACVPQFWGDAVEYDYQVYDL